MSSGSSTLALVESPAQLLNVIELAHAARSGQDLDDLGELRTAVLAPAQGRSRQQLRAVVGLARQEGLEVTWHEPRTGGPSVARTVRSLLPELGRTRRLVVGDPFSGLLQVVVGLVRPTDVIVVDDGTATLELMRQWASGEALHRWHQPYAGSRAGTSARAQVAAVLCRRLGPGTGTRLRLFTCMPLTEAGVGSTGVTLHPNTYAWLKRRWADPDVRDGVDLLGTSLVESGVVEPGAYLDGVGRLAAQHGVTRYLAHRRESEDKLARIAGLGIEIARPTLPLELEFRRGPVNAELISFPSTVVHTLPVVLAGTRVVTRVCAVPGSWYRSGVGEAAEAFLRRVTTSAPSSHRLEAVPC